MTAAKELKRIDGVLWWITHTVQDENDRIPVPLCPQHHLKLESFNKTSKIIICPEDDHKFTLPRPLWQEKIYVLNKIDSLIFSKMSTISLDDELTVVAKEELRDSDFWVRAKVTESKAGTRLIIWAGSKSAKNKTQLFLEPELKRMSFDQNDDHPLEVFTKVEAIFVDRVKTSIQSD